MPGLTIIADATCTPVGPGVTPAGLVPFDDWTREVVLQTPRLTVMADVYPGYPIVRVDDARCTAIVEGCVYDAAAAELHEELLGIAATIGRGSVPEDRVARLAGRDGEFVAVLVDRVADLALVVTDRHGRLPLYAATADGRAIVSRGVEPALALLGRRRFRRLGIAEYLLFGFPLGTATLFDGVERLPPASVVALPGGRVRLSHAPLDVGEKDARLRGDRDGVARLAGAVTDACRRRVRAGGPVLVSLSGGIDSRMVAGALARADTGARAVTHGDHDGSAPRDVRLAERVAATLGLPWEHYAVPPPTGAEACRLLALTGGANYLGMSRVLPFLDAVRRRHGSRATFFTGDLGDRLLGHRTPLATLRDDADVARYVLRHETILPPAQVAAMTGVCETTLFECVRARLATYPERDPAQRYVHFLFAERAARWVYEGEDRNRAFFWHATPFYAPDVFDVAIRMPDREKRGDRLRAAVLQAIAPAAAALPNAATQAPPGAFRAAARQRASALARALLFRTAGEEAERRLRRWLRPASGGGPRAAALACVADQMRRPGPAREYLRPDAVESLLDDARAYQQERFSVVLTITSLLDQHGEEACVLDRYRDVVMM